ncbi:MAG: WecB/TagA/CpsF family glycosyltransferase [Candidatus Delongbacteria bacterium]
MTVAEKNITAFGLKIHPWTMRESLDHIEHNVVSRESFMQHIVVNAAKIVHAQKDEELRNAINNSDLVNIDGKPVVWALKLLGHKVPEKVSGVDLFVELVRLAEEKGYRPYFLGAKKEVLEQMVKNLGRDYPELKIAGYRDGYFKKEDEQAVADDIKKSSADMLFLGITSPKKEIFLDKFTKYMNVPFSMGVGGTFDIVSGKTKRAPVWMQNWGLEWFYRFLQEPKRMWKRYLVTNTLFIILVIKEFFKRK